MNTTDKSKVSIITHKQSGALNSCTISSVSGSTVNMTANIKNYYYTPTTFAVAAIYTG
jgi:hypothetical protein